MMMTRNAIVLWICALIAIIVGSIFLRLGDGVRAQAVVAGYAANATQREIARIQSAGATPIPLTTHLIARGLISNVVGDKANLERTGANDALTALIDFERRGLGAIGQFSFAVPEPGRVSGVVTANPIPAAQK
jgi:hypothetical protein